MKVSIKWDVYIEMVKFIGECFGDNVEVVLHDLTNLEHSVIAIHNGHITGRTVGAPLTMFALNKINNERYKDKNRIIDYKGVAPNGNSLRSSSLFIRNDKGDAIGMLCVNIDISDYKKAEEIIKKLSFVMESPTYEKDDQEGVENYPNSMSVMVADILKEVLADNPVDMERLTPNEKIKIVEQLQTKGLFQIKGAVSEVAEHLLTSEATIYRYLSKINKNLKREKNI